MWKLTAQYIKQYLLKDWRIFMFILAFQGDSICEDKNHLFPSSQRGHPLSVLHMSSELLFKLLWRWITWCTHILPLTVCKHRTESDPVESEMPNKFHHSPSLKKSRSFSGKVVQLFSFVFPKLQSSEATCTIILYCQYDDLFLHWCVT